MNGNSERNDSELLSLVSRDMTSLSDRELQQLLDQTRQEASRRKIKGGTSTAITNFQAKYVFAIAFLIIGFVIMFKAETFGLKSDVAKTETKGSDGPAQWFDEEDTVVKKKSPDDNQDKTLMDSIKAEKDDSKEKETEEVGDDKEIDGNKETETEDAGQEDATKDADKLEKDTTMKEKVAADSSTRGINPSLDDLLFKADVDSKIAAIKEGRRAQIKYQYQRRSSTLIDISKQKFLASHLEKWGSWQLQDDKAADRPRDDFPGAFPNRDIPWDKFPSNAWQVDTAYLDKWIPEAIALVERAMEAILAEYGWSKFDIPNRDFEARIEGTSFEVQVLNMTVDNPAEGKQFKGSTRGGFVTQKYFDGLVRRTMHSILTQDTFTLVMGGHSAAAAHGNHFQQSYTMQFHKVMEPVFARLGIKLLSHNIAYGGLGTVQTSLAGGDLYGKEIDILVWDSSMTEPSGPAYELFVRQVLLSGNRVPVLLGGMRDTLRDLDLQIDAEVGMFGTGVDGVPEVTDPSMADKIPWAARYMRCDNELKQLCKEKEYDGTCWIDRDDYTPQRPQKKEPGGRASWHPGYKFHAIRGRIIAFTVLRAMHKGLTMWNESADKKLPEEEWHVKNHFDNIRAKLQNVPEEKAACFQYKELEPKSFCTHPFQGVSEMTPRANPKETAIRNVMKPAGPDGYIPPPMESVYDPPDVFNPALAPPKDEFDYLAVVENGVEFSEFVTLDNSYLPPLAMKTGNKLIPVGIKDVKPGIGWGANTNANPDECDGSYDGFCGRGEKNECLLYGHHDNRGGLMFDAYSGWGVFTLPNVKLGVILIRVEWWHNGGENTRTIGWESVNNGTEVRRMRRMRQSHHRRRLQHVEEEEYWAGDWYRNETEIAAHRRLKGNELCDEFQFDFAVNGKMTTYGKKEFNDKLQVFQRVVQVQTILNDESLTKGTPHDVEFAVRMRGCEKRATIYLSHIYWA